MISHSERLRQYSICTKLGHEPVELRPDTQGFFTCQNCMVRYFTHVNEDPTTVPMKEPQYVQK